MNMSKTESQSQVTPTRSEQQQQQQLRPHRPFEDAFRALDRLSESMAFPLTSFFSDPFFRDDYHNDYLEFRNRFSRMLEPFSRGFERFGDSTSFFRHDDDELSKHTNRLFDKFCNDENKEKIENLEKVDKHSEESEPEFLSHPKELEDLYNRYKANSQGSEGKSYVAGKSFSTSTITKNGKSVTVSRNSELTPDGEIKTTVDEKFRDNEGHDKTKSWKKQFALGGNENQGNMIKDASNKSA